MGVSEGWSGLSVLGCGSCVMNLGSVVLVAENALTSNAFVVVYRVVS